MGYYQDTLKAVLFDLDGVITDTARFHYIAWKQLADEQGVYFDEDINEQLKGVSRMASLEIILQNASRSYSQEEKERLAFRKNEEYKKLLTKLTPDDILPGALLFIEELRHDGKKIALGSASKNAPTILQYLNIENMFDEVVCGLDVTKSKPDPEVFLLGAERLGFLPQECLVVEDAAAGIDAATKAGMKSIGIGNDDVGHATIHLSSTSELSTTLIQQI